MKQEHMIIFEELLNSERLTDWERKTFKEIYDRNTSALSHKQFKMIERAHNKYITGKTKQPLSESTSSCSIEQFPDGWKLVDNKGTVYGKGLTKGDASMILNWFSDVLDGEVQSPIKTKPTPTPNPTNTHNPKEPPF